MIDVAKMVDDLRAHAAELRAEGERLLAEAARFDGAADGLADALLDEATPAAPRGKSKPTPSVPAADWDNACDQCDRTFRTGHGLLVHKARSHKTAAAQSRRTPVDPAPTPVSSPVKPVGVGDLGPITKTPVNQQALRDNAADGAYRDAP